MNSDSHKLTVILITLLYCIRGISKQVKCADNSVLYMRH